MSEPESGTGISAARSVTTLRPHTHLNETDEALICEYCGETITALPQKCMALDSGWCRP